MTTKKYSGEKAIQDKIQELFVYRKLTALLERSQLIKNKPFTRHLVDIQYQIYLLDAYLESQWELDEKKLETCWHSIMESLSTLQYSGKQIKSLLTEIKEYERIEINCRKNKWPTKESFTKFYLTKSCDVRLIRHLVYDAQPDLSLWWKESAWKYYDRITEINDDIADVKEDLNTFNGNRFLISILRKGSTKTRHQYQAYLENVMKKADRYFNKNLDRGENALLYEWTMARSAETLALLEKTIQENDPEIFSTSLLLQHMK
jgi:hypothetical protein